MGQTVNKWLKLCKILAKNRHFKGKHGTRNTNSVSTGVSRSRLGLFLFFCLPLHWQFTHSYSSFKTKLNLIQLLPFSWPGLGLGEEVDPVEAVTRFLDTLEAEALLHLDTLITDQEAQDRVLLEDVQVTRHSEAASVRC